MKIERHFLDWSTPALPSVAEFLFRKFAYDDAYDLSSAIVVLPGRRAIRRLKEIFVWQVEQDRGEKAPLLFTPPRFVTFGQLPETLLDADVQIANEVQTLQAWTAALRGMHKAKLQTVFATLPADNDFLAFWPLAKELQSLDSELAGEDVTYEAIADHCRQFDAASASRWRVLREISQSAQRHLVEANLCSRDEARRRALQDKRARCNATIVLVSTVDLNAITRKLLTAANCEVCALIHAPESEAQGFGDFGELRPEHWQEKLISLRDEQIHIVEREADQAAIVVEILQSLDDVRDHSIALGLGDDAIAPLLERAVEQQGRSARYVAEANVAESSPMQFLKVLCDFAGDARPEYFAALLLHPDFCDWLARRPEYSAISRGLQVLADDYFARRLPSRIGEKSFGLPSELKEVVVAIKSLLPEECSQPQPLDVWLLSVREILETVYGGCEYAESIPEQANLFRALDAIGELLDELADGEASSPLMPQLAFCEAVRFVLKLAESTLLPEPFGASAVELLGWLDIHLDDTPVLTVTGFNEGRIPECVVFAPFLTDTLRREFHLLDNRRRYARDAYFLTAIAKSRQKLDVICARRSAQGEPLQPSRLLFACEADSALRRIKWFYEEEENTLQTPSPLVLEHDTLNTLATIPRPRNLYTPLSELNVTAFRDYLTCPYRFYLKHICKLRSVGEIASEMESNVFGTLLHEVLRDFGNEAKQSDGRVALGEDGISARLLELLEAATKNQFGKARLSAVEIQLHQMERRLKSFAHAQAREFEEGWAILHVEHQLQRNVNVDGEPFLIHGKVDRIDFHEARDEYRILDYKTGDKKRPPEKTHRVGRKDEKQWVDLQLPLYRRLALASEFPGVAIGYFCLPAELKEADLEMAMWDESEWLEAEGVADEVIRHLRRQVYWPPGEPPAFADEIVAAICQDIHQERDQIIAQTDAAEIFWPLFDESSAARSTL